MYNFNSGLLKLLALEIDRSVDVGIFVGTEQCYNIEHIQSILYNAPHTIVTNVIQMSFLKVYFYKVSSSD